LRSFIELDAESAMDDAAGPVGTRRARALLESDRRAANEARPCPEQTLLQTTDYTVPLLLRLKRSFREDDRVRVGSLIASASIVLVLLGSLVGALGTARASQDGARARTLATRDATHARSATPAVSYQPFAVRTLEAPPHEPEVVRDRLQRARHALRIPGKESAAKARSLLEDLLREKPRSGRAYAALAEACLRLRDASCARDAATKAVARQPRRVKYRALAARIDRMFAQGE
jgi:cytochrome c-type biogenesis protein CcmH/NrfG